VKRLNVKKAVQKQRAPRRGPSVRGKPTRKGGHFRKG
jgi:hypothetical protein